MNIKTSQRVAVKTGSIPGVSIIETRYTRMGIASSSAGKRSREGCCGGSFVKQHPDAFADALNKKKMKTFDPVPEHLPPSMEAEDGEALKRSGSVRNKREVFQSAVQEKEALPAWQKEKPASPGNAATLARINSRHL